MTDRGDTVLRESGRGARRWRGSHLLPHDEVIHVFTVAHDHRRPGYWKDRSAERDG